MKNGLDLTINDKNYWFFHKISVVIADWPEATTFCLTYKSPNSNNPCHFCLVTKDNLSNIKLLKKEMILRNHQNMTESLQLNLEKSVSIESVSNYFWRFP